MAQQAEFPLTNGSAEPKHRPDRERAPTFRVYVHGRLRGITKARLKAAVTWAGGELLAAPLDASSVILAHSTAERVLETLALPKHIPVSCQLESENGLRRTLGLARPLAEVPRMLDAAAIERAAKIEAKTLQWLVRYDVLEPLEDRFSYVDLLAAKEVSRLLSDGFGLGQVVACAMKLAAAGHGLSEARLIEAPWGEILQRHLGTLGRLTGAVASEAATCDVELRERRTVALRQLGADHGAGPSHRPVIALHHDGRCRGAFYGSPRGHGPHDPGARENCSCPVL